jgi:hypothetical protein
MDEQRRLATRQLFRVKQYNFLPFEEMAEDIRKVSTSALMPCTGLQQSKLCHFHSIESVKYTGCSFASKTK